MVLPSRWMTPFIVPPGEMGIASFETPAGTSKFLELVGDTESVTVEGAVVITTAQTASWSYGKEVQSIGGYRMAGQCTYDVKVCWLWDGVWT